MQPLNVAGMLDMGSLRWGDALQQGLLLGQQMQANKMVIQKDLQAQQQQEQNRQQKAQAMGMLQQNPNDQQAQGMLAMIDPQASNAYGNVQTQGLQRQQLELQMQAQKQEEMKNQFYQAKKIFDQTPPEQQQQVYDAMVKEWEANGTPLPEPLKTYSPQNVENIKQSGLMSEAHYQEWKMQQEAEKSQADINKTKAETGNIAFEQGYKNRTSARDYQLKQQELELKRQEADAKKQEIIDKRAEFKNKPLSPEATGKLTTAETVIHNITGVRDLLENNFDNKVPYDMYRGGLMRSRDPNVQKLAFYIDNTTEHYQKLISGASGSDSETKKYTEKLMIRPGDSVETIRAKLDEMEASALIVSEGLQGGKKPAEIYKELKARPSIGTKRGQPQQQPAQNGGGQQIQTKSGRTLTLD